MNTNCEKYQRGGQWYCDRCQTVWDIDDDDPPECKPFDTDNHIEPLSIFEQLKHDLRQKT